MKNLHIILGLFFASITFGNISPYLQTPSPTSIYICWKTDNGTASRVKYGTTTSLGEVADGDYESIASQYIWHSVKLTDLNPNTVYYYRYVIEDGESEIFKFKTLPTIEANNGHIRFAVYGDNRTYPEDHSRVINAMKDKFIELYGEGFESEIDFVINAGDIVTDGRNLSEYQIEYFEPITPLSGKIPFMVCIGNHEKESNYYYQFMKYEDCGGFQGERYYQFRIGPAVFISLNSNSNFRTNIQIEWLNSILSEAQNEKTVEWIFSFCHHCGHTEHNTRLNTDYVQNRILPTLANYSKAEFLIYGHSHCYARGTLLEGNLRLMCSGGGGGPLSRWGDHSYQRDYQEIQKSFGHYNFSIIDLDLKNHSYSCETYSLGHDDLPLNNVLIDSFYRNHRDTIPPTIPIAITVNDSVDLPYSLEASEFSGQHSIMSSHFQVTNIAANYSSPVIDVNRDYENLLGETDPPDYNIVDLNEGIELTKLPLSRENINIVGTYYWRVRYRDRNLLWSNWSEEESITVRSIEDDPLSIDNISAIPDKFKLSNAYPNPFNSVTTIKYSLSKESFVQITIYDLKGRKITELVNRSLAVGEYKVSWNAKDHASGIYFVIMNSSNLTSTRKILLLK
jgi:predicted phosphodiesterase